MLSSRSLEGDPITHLKSSSGFVAELVPVPLEFAGSPYTDVFARKNNRSLAETLAHSRYAKLAPLTETRYRQALDMPLGEFLVTLKRQGDGYYRRFLNPYGDLSYCTFRIAEPRHRALKGIYAYFVDDQLVYIGRCRDAMGKRVDQGYGTIDPKNCYIDGQATNCHLNALIAPVANRVGLGLCAMDDDAAIEREEAGLIGTYLPPWNLQH